jgi:hypothetical protein
MVISFEELRCGFLGKYDFFSVKTYCFSINLIFYAGNYS